MTSIPQTLPAAVPQSPSRRRWFELFLVVFVSCGTPFLNSLYVFLKGAGPILQYPHFRWTLGIIHESASLLLLAYVAPVERSNLFRTPIICVCALRFVKPIFRRVDCSRLRDDGIDRTHRLIRLGCSCQRLDSEFLPPLLRLDWSNFHRLHVSDLFACLLEGPPRSSTYLCSCPNRHLRGASHYLKSQPSRRLACK